MKVTWQWGSDTPVRAKQNQVPLRPTRSALVKATKPHSNQRSKALIDQPANDPSNESPKGLYKFQEEMRRIHEAAEPDNACDVAYADDVESATADSSGAMSITNDSFSLSPIRSVEIEEPDKVKAPPDRVSAPVVEDTTLTTIKNDLLDNSDFDQELFTCTENVESNIIELTQAKKSAEAKPNEAKMEAKIGSANVAQRTKEVGKERDQDAAKSDQFDNDESIDDILGRIDDSFIMNTVKNNSKFLRHKSMPQKEAAEPSGRKSFSRHESMPASSAQIASMKMSGVAPASNSSQSSSGSGISRELLKSTVQ